jgi:hypothetical protein
VNYCHLKLLLILACLIVVIIGLWLSIWRERVSIESGRIDRQHASGSLADGKFNLKFASGLMMILIGLACGTYLLQDPQSCGSEPLEVPHQPGKDSLNHNSKLEPKAVKVVGLIVDAETNEHIAYATISVHGRSETERAGPDGLFELNLIDFEGTSIWLRVEKQGYRALGPVRRSIYGPITIQLQKE